jgi:hypothetical protein
MLGWFGRKPKIPDATMKLHSPPLGEDGGPAWTTEIENATQRFGSEFLVPVLYEVAPDQCLGAFVAKATLRTELRTYQGRATLIEQNDGDFRATILVTAPSAPDERGHPYDACNLTCNESISKDVLEDTCEIIRQVCEETHLNVLTREGRAPSVDYSEWHVDGNTLIRTYKFANVPSPEMSTSLRIECRLSKSPSGFIATEITFCLQPYLYLMRNRRPFEDHFVPAPFSVALWAAGGAGTEESPVMEGGSFNVSGYSIEDEPETAFLVFGRQDDVMLWVRAIASGREMTFNLSGEAEGAKLRLRLPNDLDFYFLYAKLRDKVALGGPT